MATKIRRDLEFLEMLRAEIDTVTEGSQSAAIHHLSASILEALHEWKDALEAYNRAHKVDPSSFPTQYRRAIVSGRLANDVEIDSSLKDRLVTREEYATDFNPFATTPTGNKAQCLAWELAASAYLLDRSVWAERVTYYLQYFSPHEGTAPAPFEVPSSYSELRESARHTAIDRWKTLREEVRLLRGDDVWLPRYAAICVEARLLLRGLAKFVDVELSVDKLLESLGVSFRLSRGRLHPVWVRRDPAFQSERRSSVSGAATIPVEMVVGRDPGYEDPGGSER